MSETQPEDAVAWRTIIYGTPVLSADGQHAGVVREVLGSDAEDIFHGLRLQLNHGRRDVMVPAASITAITAGHVQSDRSLAELEALPPYAEESTYHLASVGWLRKHLGWRQDSQGDEEPG